MVTWQATKTVLSANFGLRLAANFTLGASPAPLFRQFPTTARLGL
jgi:hypothetical protein